LPASSIYWHFKNKDDLIAAVIERSFADWLRAWQVPIEGSPQDRLVGLAMQIANALLDSPDFIRLGLMLSLERRPVEPRARAMFLQSRAQTFDQLVEAMRGFTPDLTDAQVHQLVSTPSPAQTDCSSPKRSAAMRWTCSGFSNCTPVRCTTARCG
jgi:AcrR family transcriptional regulator